MLHAADVEALQTVKKQAQQATQKLKDLEEKVHRATTEFQQGRSTWERQKNLLQVFITSTLCLSSSPGHVFKTPELLVCSGGAAEAEAAGGGAAETQRDATRGDGESEWETGRRRHSAAHRTRRPERVPQRGRQDS